MLLRLLLLCMVVLGAAPLARADTTVDVLGATGLPDPTVDPSYMQAAQEALMWFWPTGTMRVVLTPEQLAPWSGSLSLDASEAQGLADLEQVVSAQLASGDEVGIVGMSQSADIASLLMRHVDPMGTPSRLPLSFVLMGDEMNPNGGLLERFTGLDVLGVDFAGATPADDFPTVVYTHEYDGFADFCAFPADVICDVNALVGILYDHSYTASDLAAAIQLPTAGPTESAFYIIPAPLPLAQLVGSVPAVGRLAADLLTPDLTYLVNIGYGNPFCGWSLEPANVPTPAELLPPLSELSLMPDLLVQGAAQGVHDALAGLPELGVVLGAAAMDWVGAL